MILPALALQNHTAVLGKTGAGKSHLARLIVEGLLNEGGRVCVIDPAGGWWGLRSNAAGTGPGFPVVVLGGHHADVALGATHGAEIAEIVGGSNTPLILDTRMMTVGDRTRFFIGFAETLLRKNKGPLHLVIDEAHLFAPQGKVSDIDSGKMLHAANNLVSLGRGVGLRIMMLTQRPAKLHKDSLTQVETLIAMRLIAPQDRAAVEAWIGEWADPKEGREMLSSLPSLATGEGWVWSPLAGILKRMKFPRIATFDSSRAPDDDGETAGPIMASIDLPGIEARLGKVAAETKANDPKLLRRRIAELEREARAAAPAVVADEAVIDDARKQAYAGGWLDGLGVGRKEGWEACAERARELIGEIADAPSFARAEPPPTPKPNGQARPRAIAVPAPRPVVRKSTGPATDMPGPQRKLLTVLAQYPQGRTKKQLAILAGYAHNGGAFNNPLGNLRSRGWAKGGPDCIVATQAGLDALGSWEPLPTGPELREYWFGNLDGPPAKLLRALCDAYPKGLSKNELARRTGYEASGGAFNNPLGKLRSLELVTGRGGADIQASEDLF